MNKTKYATHNALTYAASVGLLSRLVAPFSRCQRVSLVTQWMRGARLFDLRVRPDKEGSLVAAHGLWTGRCSLNEAMWHLSVCASANDPAYVQVTLERGGMGDEVFVENVERIVSMCANVLLTDVCRKHPRWTLLARHHTLPTATCYTKLDGSTWHTLLPLPRLWHKLRWHKFQIQKDKYNIVDFL